MELHTHGAKKYPTSALLRSSAGLGWSTISAELRSHRTGAGQCQETIPTTGAIWLTPIGVGDNEITITAPLAKTMH